MNEEAKPHEVTRILQAWSAGDHQAPAELMALVYEELRQLARSHLRQERAGHTLQPTALVHEAYLKLVNTNDVNWQSRAHFFGIAARLMRRILVDHAHAHNTAKRGGLEQKVSLVDIEAAAPESNLVDLLSLDEALKNFAENYPRKSDVVELKLFGGLEAKEIAEVLQVSQKTVLRDWSFAKLWLRRELSPERAC